MDSSAVLALKAHVAQLEDPRVERTRLHQLLDSVVMASCAVIAGAERWDDIALFGEAKHARASHLSRVAECGCPRTTPSTGSLPLWTRTRFVQAVPTHVQAALPRLPPQVIALAGKTVRGSQDRSHGKAAIHLVSAWGSREPPGGSPNQGRGPVP
jgi:DDE_Tnp_1-associated